MGKDPWIRSDRTSRTERRVGRMLHRMRVRFRHHSFVGGREVDFLIPRPGRRGLLVEVDGDLWHFNLERTAEKDRVLRAAGWEVVHFRASEVWHTPLAVEEALEAALDGVPR